MKTVLPGPFRFTLAGLLLTALTACGGSGYGGGSDGGGGQTTYTVGGQVTGLTGAGLVLQNNGGDDLAVTAAGSFRFATALANGAAYAVTVKTQPSSPAENCVVSAGAGAATSDVTNVAVACTSTTFTVGGSVTELEGSGLVLQNNLGDDLPINSSGGFTFTTGLFAGAAYAVTVKTQPSGPAQTCAVGTFGSGDGTGTIADSNVENILVTCGLHFAYAANAGDNTLSQYTVDSLTGTLTAIGTPIATGTSPYAITGSPDRKHLYVVNRVSNNISVYSVNVTSGALTEIAGSPFNAGTDPQALTFDPSGAYMYVANTGSNNLSVYSVDTGTGALTPLSPATYATGAGPTAIGTDHSGKFVFVANNGGSDDISVFAVTAGTGALTPVAGSPFPAGGNPHSLSVSRYYDFVYTANTGGANSTISEFSVNPTTGVLTAVVGSPFAIPVSNYIGVYSGYGDTLYVTTGASVVGYFPDLNGQLTTGPGYSAAAGANAYSVTVSNSIPYLDYIYVGNDGAASISAYRLGAFGELSAVPGSPFAAGNNPDFIAIL